MASSKPESEIKVVHGETNTEAVTSKQESKENPPLAESTTSNSSSNSSVASSKSDSDKNPSSTLTKTTSRSRRINQTSLGTKISLYRLSF
eukprot:7639209-Ditylum_brightwellii.AAC.1